MREALGNRCFYPGCGQAENTRHVTDNFHVKSLFEIGTKIFINPIEIA